MSLEDVSDDQSSRSRAPFDLRRQLNRSSQRRSSFNKEKTHTESSCIRRRESRSTEIAAVRTVARAAKRDLHRLVNPDVIRQPVPAEVVRLDGEVAFDVKGSILNQNLSARTVIEDS